MMQTEELCDGENIANTLIDNVISSVMKTIGVRTDTSCECEEVELQNIWTDEVLDNGMLKGESIEKVKELNEAESFNINTHMSEMIFSSLPDLCCSLSTTSNKGEGDYQSNTLRSAKFYHLDNLVSSQYNGQESCSSMITETSNSGIAEVLQEKICNLSFDSIHLSDCEEDQTPKNSAEPKGFLKIPGQVISEADVPQNGNKESFLQKSQKFCQFNNKHYLPLNTTESTGSLTFVNEYCDGECEIHHLDLEKELLSESSDELVNAQRDSMLSPDLCCSLSMTSNKWEGDYQSNTLRSTKFYRLENLVSSQYNGQESCSSMITETSNSGIAEALQEKINNLSFDSIHLSDCEADQTPNNSAELKWFLKITGQVISEADVPENENKESFLQKSQKFCQFNNKHYMPLNTTESTSSLTFVNEYCDGECEIHDLDKEKELLSESSDELVNIQRDSEEILIPVRRLIQTNPLICSTNESPMRLSSPCFPEKFSSDSIKDIETTHAVRDNKPLKEFSNWEEAVEVEINVIEPVKSDLQSVNEEKDVVETRQYWSSVGLISENQIDRTHLGPTDVSGIESIPGINKVDVKYPKKEKKQHILDTENVIEVENQPSTSSKGLYPEENINYLSITNKTEKEKKKSKFVSRIASVFSGILRPKKHKK